VLSDSGCGATAPCWWPGTVVASEEGGGGYRVHLKGAGGLSPPRGCTPAPQEETGVTPGRLAPAGRYVPRWRLCGGDALVEVKVSRGIRVDRSIDRSACLLCLGGRAERGGLSRARGARKRRRWAGVINTSWLVGVLEVCRLALASPARPSVTHPWAVRSGIIHP
jgi:hypothetical protein